MCRSLNDRLGGSFLPQAGVTLLEMILFIVVIAVAGVVIMTMMSAPLSGTGEQVRAVTAAQLAQGRMEVVLGQKRRDGFPGFDPCPDSGLSACTLPAGWTASTTVVPWEEGGDPEMETYAVIVVTVNGPDDESHTLRTLVARLGGGG